MPKQQAELVEFRRMLDMSGTVTPAPKSAPTPVQARSSAAITPCPMCGNPVPESELSADDECEVCAALRRLRITLEKRGLLHPNLFERANNSVLPPSDRE
jgi:hypothetical protein